MGASRGRLKAGTAAARAAEAAARAPQGEALKVLLREAAVGLGGPRLAVYAWGIEERQLSPAASADAPPDSQVEVLNEVARSGCAVRLGPGGNVLPEGGAGRLGRACLPAFARGELAGVLDASWKPGTSGAPGVLDALRLLATVAGTLLENQRLEEENRARVEGLLATQRIGREMTSTLDVAKLLRLVSEEALRLTPAEGALLYLLDAREERLVLEAWAGEPPPPDRTAVAVGYGIPGWVARHGQPLRVSDRPSGREPAGYRPGRGQLAVPLLSEGRVVGVLALYARRRQSFTPRHEELLGVFAAQAAKAIEAARFFESVRRERDFRDRILGGTPNAVLALDAERRVVWVNEAARRVLDIAEEPLGNPIERYVAEPRLRDALQKVLDGEEALESLEIALGKGASARHLLVNVFPMAGERTAGATLIAQDLTERRRLDEQVNRMARLASIGQLAAGIAHEIRNPLTGIGISLDVLRQGESLSAPGQSLLDDIGREIDRLELLIRGILDFARPQPPQKRPMRVAKALEWHRTFAEQCGKKDVTFCLEMRSDPKIEGDPEKLKQLFLNLALNALEATEAGGTVRIVAEHARAGGRSWARVLVEDTGRGMDRETLTQVFNPFFTTKSDGTGLGLAIAHSIAEQHGGHVDVRSTPRAGTCFTVELPALERGEK